MGSLFQTLNLCLSVFTPFKKMSKQDNTVVHMQNQAYPNPALDMPPAFPGYAQNMPIPDPGYAQNMPHTAFSSKNAPVVDLSSESVRTVCKNCFKEISTRVDSSISGTGWAWAIICCLCGSWIASCLVNCLPGFRKYTQVVQVAIFSLEKLNPSILADTWQL